VSDVERLDARRYRVHFASQSREGAYQVTVGPEIQDLAGNRMDQDGDGEKGEAADDRYTFVVRIDTTPPHVVSSAPLGTLNVPVHEVELTFNEAVDAATLPTSAVTVFSPGGSRHATEIAARDETRVVLRFAPENTDGAFRVEVAPLITDLAGNALDQDADGVGGEPQDDLYTTAFTQLLPDLTVTSLTSPAEFPAGRVADIEWTVANVGGGAATGVWTDTVYLSADNAAGNDVELARVQFDQPVAAGERYQRTVPVTIPADARGSRWLVVVTNRVGELAEAGAGSGNNTKVAVSPIWVTARPYADLRVSDVQAPASLSAGEEAAISWTVRNHGTGATSAPAWQDVVYLSADDRLDGRDVELKRFANPDFLAPGESYTRTEEVYIPQSSLGSAVYVIVATDVQDREEEFDFENNNTERTAAAVPVVASLPARLTVTKVEPPAAVAVGSSPTFRWTVTNTGGTTISSGWYNRTGWDDGLVLSRDDVYQEQEDFFLGSHNYFTGLPLRPGQSYTQTGRGERAIPYWEPGTYYLIVIPDTHWGAGAAFRESTIPRDYGVAPIQLTDTNPVDLVVASVGAPTVSEVGASLKIDWQVTNRGGARSEVSTWDDEVFLSRDRQLDATDVSLGANHQSRLLPQSASYEMTAQPFVVPADFVPGDYYVVVETDSGDHLREADNNNNTLASTHPVRILRIETDLQVTSVQAPVNVTAGDSVNVSWVVRNAAQDATRVATWEDAVYLSSDDNLNVQEDRKLGAFPHSGALSFQDEYPRSEQVLFPDNVEGTFSLFVVTDSRDDVHELNAEGNNAKAPDHRVQLSDLAPNLVVQELTVPASAIAGTQVEIGWSVKNSGDAPAQPAWTDTVYLSADATLDRTKDKMLTFLRHDATLAVQDSYGPAGGITRVIVPDRLDGEFFIFFVSDSGDAVYEKAATADNVVSRPIRITDLAPDLEVRSASVPQTGVAGQAIEVGFSIANKGTEHTGVSWRDAFYLSADTQFDPQQDRLFGAFVRTTPVGIGADYGPPATPAYLRLPDRIEGPYYVFVVADYENAVYEKSEGADNVFRVEHPITVELQAPDLRAAVTDAPAAATAGTVINVSWTVTNRGLQPTSETVWQDGVYLSADAIFEPAGDIELGVVTHSGILARDAGYTQVRPFELRQDLEGTHHIYVVADVRRQVFEHTAEDNNLGANAWATQITGVHADLQVTALDAPSAASTGSAISVSWTVANRGDDATPGGTWVDAVYLSRDEALDAGDRQLATLPHQDRLSAGGTYARQVQVTLPSDLSGSLFLLVKTDASPFNQLYEYQAEDNNVRSRAVEVSLVPPADLRVTAVTIPASGWSGQKMLVQWTVANEGGLAAQTEQRGWYDSVYLSRDPYLDPGTDVHLGAVLHEGTLAPSGASYAAQAETRLPVGAAGPYYVLVRTDSNNRLPEGNAEQNNTTASLATISIQLTPPADLEVTSATAPAAGNCGEPADWEYRVVNQGTLDAMGAWYDSLYLSADATWDLDDPRIARVYHEGDLAQNAGYTQTVTAGVPPVLPGDYYLIVRTDVRDNVRESGQGEENNTLVSSAQIRVEARQLELGQADSSRTLTTDGQRYYRIEDVPSGKTLRLSLTGLGDAASARLYVSRDRLPTRIAFDVASGEPSSHPQLLIPDTLGGTYYVLVYGEQIPNGPASYSILAEALSLSVFDTQYGQGGNAGRLTIEITGAAFDRTVTARLSDGAAWQLPAVDHYYVDKTRLFATFDLLGVTPGTYDVVVSNGEGATRIVRNGLRVAAGGGGSVRPQIDAPTLVRRKRGFPFTVQWTNEGLNDAPAPLLTVGNSAAFGFSPNDTSAGMRYTFLGVSTDGGPPGILRPGQTESLTLHATGEESQEAFHLFVDRVLKDPSAPFDWSEVRDDMQPIDLTSGEFQPVFEHIVNKVGRTAGDYLAMLSRNAGLLPLPPGERPEVRSLLALEVADAWAELGTSIRGALSTEDLSIQLGGRSVAATETISGAVYTALTRNDGSFVFPNLPPGAYQFAVPQLLVTQVSPAIADLAAGQALTGVSIGVERGAVLTVSVRAAADHAVIAGAIVSVRSGDQIVGAGVADAQGSATMSPLPFGSYTLVVEGAGGAPKTVSDVSVSQTTQELLLELEPQAVIRGHATRLGDAAADLPIVVAATLPGTDFVQFAIVNEDGVFAVEGLAAGTYDLVFAAQGHQGQVLSGLAVSAGMAADVGDVRLVPNPSPEMEGETPQKGPDPAKMADQKFHEALEEAEKYFRWVLFPGVYLARGAEYVGILKQFLDSTAPNLTHRTYLPGSETVEGLELASLSTVAVYTGKMPGFRDSSTSEDLFSKVMAHARTAVVDMFKKGNPAVACDKFQDGKTVEFDIANLDFGKFGYLRYTDGNRPDDEKDEWAFDDTIAGGVGHGGNPPPPREVPDRRSLTGKVVVRLLDPTHVEVKAKDFRITVDDTFDFWPGNLAEADKTIFWVTSKLYVLEIYNHAYDVAFTVMWNDKKERSLTGAIPKQQCCEAESGAAGETIGESCCVGDSCDDGPHDDDTDVSESESHDPNDKIGPSGIDMLMYVDGRVPLPYMVRFENDAKASASAILVTITDQLDGDLDWGTFELRDMQFGSHRISVPPGLTQYQTRVDLRPEGSDLLVEVDARFDVRTGLAQWTFTGIDPATGELTWDPLAGFLPPNNPDVHDGEGFVTYALRPKAGLPSGTEISNMASIVFDWNEPIDTPLIVHRIDAAPPASAVDDLPVVVNGSTFQVTWAGADDALGSGVKAYDIYVSDNGGPYQRWLAATQVFAASFIGRQSHTYRFFSTATDYVGHWEYPPVESDAQTTVASTTWNNPKQPTDVNGDGHVLPIDVLLIINYINVHPNSTDPPAPPAEPPPFYDVSNDRKITPLDVLMVINYINVHGQREAEGEATVASDSGLSLFAIDSLFAASVANQPLTSSPQPSAKSSGGCGSQPASAAEVHRSRRHVRPARLRVSDQPQTVAAPADLEEILPALAEDIAGQPARIT
jgi:subtilase family serine protease